MSVRNFNPKSVYQNRRQIVRAQPNSTENINPFSAGAFQDRDPSLVPSNGVHIPKNYRVYPWGLLTRGGSQLWSSTLYPALTGRTGYSISKAGYSIYSTSAIFQSTDVGKYIVHDDGKHDQIMEYLNPYRVRVFKSNPHDASTAAYLRGKRHAIKYHKKHGVYVLHTDTRLFYSSSLAIPSWTQMFQCGICSDPADELSKLSIFDKYMILWNSNGPYKIDLENFRFWKINTELPTTRITDVESTDPDYFERRYLYSMSLMSGEEDDLDRNRYTTGVEIQQESGTNAPDSSRKDYSSVYTSRPVGISGTTYGILTGAALTSPHDTIAGWSSYTVVQFNITINSEKKNVVANITAAVSMGEIAERIQSGLRDYWPTAKCEYDEDHFVITAPDEGSTIGYVEAGDGATDIGTAIMMCHSSEGNAQNVDYTEPSTIGSLEIPVESSGEYHSHWLFYSLFSTLRIGGNNPATSDTNNEELYIWNSDIPVAKAFVCSTLGAAFSLSEGEVVQGDVGCKIRFTDGNEYTIDTVIDSTSGTFTGAPGSPYSSASCALGGDSSLSKAIRVMTASQSGTTVTRTAGDSFESGDVGRPIFFPDGTIRWIEEYTDANNVEVTESGTISSTACCIEPKTRKWTDTLRDEPYSTEESLRARVRNYSLQNRFFVPIPDCDMGEITASMIWGCIKGEFIVHYSQADTNYRHQAGYYYEAEQREIFQEKINEISAVGGVLSIKFNNSTRSIPLNTFDSIIISDAGTAIIKASGNDVVDDSIGCLHQGGVCYTPDRLQVVVTSEPGVRIFDGVSYGKNLAEGRIQKYLDKLSPEYSTWYDPENGWNMMAYSKVDA